MSDAATSRDRFAKLQDLWRKLNRPVRVLLVEDDSLDIALIERVLDGYYAELVIVMTCEDAIQSMTRNDYDLCLLDLKLSERSGIDVLLWAKGHGKAVPFVALTGLNDSSPMIKRALDAGVECVMQKPLTAENAKMILGSAK